MSKSLKQRLATAVRAQTKGAWDYEDEDYPMEDWKYAVQNGDTRLGYFDWVIHNIESEMAS